VLVKLLFFNLTVNYLGIYDIKLFKYNL